MALTPLDIKNKTFTKQMRGYSPDEVQGFLDSVLSDYTEALRKNRDYEKSIKHLEEKLRYFNELKEALNQSIIVAQETADQVKDSAQKGADVIVADANNESSELLTRANREASEMLADAKEKSEKLIREATKRANFLISDATAKANSLAAETDDLKKKTRSFHQRLTLLLESQLEITKSDEWDDLLQPFTSYVTGEHQNFKNAVDMSNLEQTKSEIAADSKEVPQEKVSKEPKVEEKKMEVIQETKDGEFLGQTMALDREKLNEALAKHAKKNNNTDKEKVVDKGEKPQKSIEANEKDNSKSVELPKLERRHKK